MKRKLKIKKRKYTRRAKPIVELKDSGDRREFESGAVRDRAVGKGRFDLLPWAALRAYARQMERGAAKYSDRNWEKGMSATEFLSSGIRHAMQALAGFDDEPHLDAAIWNIGCCIETIERAKRGILPAELNNIPTTYAGQDPG